MVRMVARPESPTTGSAPSFEADVLEHRRHPPKCANAARASMNHTATVEMR